MATVTKIRVWLLIAVTVAALIWGAWAEQRVWAAGDDNGCQVIGTIGNLIISRCIDDETGIVLFGNSAGMLVIEP